MTREEEIQEASRKYFDDYMDGLKGKILTVQKTFEEGAEWADKTMIEKAIDILIDLSNDGYLIDIHNHEEFEKQFRKAMEE